MTLEELQIVITTNIEQNAPAVEKLASQIGKIRDVAKAVSQGTTDAVRQTVDKTQKAIQSADNAEKKSVEVTKRACKEKAQTVEEIAAIADRAAKQYNDALKGAGNGGPLHDPVKLTGNPGTVTGSRSSPAAPAASTENTESALTRLREKAFEVKQSLAGMFKGAAQEAPAASEAAGQLAAKLDIINARADIQRRKLKGLQAEYDRVASSVGGSGSSKALKLQEQILTTEARLQSLKAQSNKTAEAVRNLDAGLSKAGNDASNAARGAEKAGAAFGTAGGGASGLSRELGRMRRQILSQILVYGLMMRGLSSLGTYIWSALKTNTAFSNSLNNLKVQFLTAFQPIYQAALPALTSLINALARTMAYIAAFISGFFGKTYSQSERAAAGLNKNVKALDAAGAAAKKAGSAAKKAGKDAKDATAGFDELNVIKPPSADTPEASADKPDTGKDAALANTDFGAPSAKPLISESQIAAAEAAGERVRKVFDKIYSFAKKYEGPIKAVIASIIGAFLAFKTIQFVSGIVNGITGAFAFLAANPAVAVALAIAGIIAGLIILYNTNKQFHDGVNTMWNDIKGIFQTVYNVVIKPIIDNIGKVVSALWTEHIKPLWDQLQVFFKQISQDLTPIVDYIVKTFGPVIVAAINTIVKVIGDIVGIVADIVKDVIKVLGGILDFLAGVFTGNWSKAWMGLKEIFGGVWDLIKDIFSGAMKVIEDLFTGAISIIEAAWSAIVGFFKTIWAGIQQVFSVAGSWFGQIFGEAWTAIQSAWSSVISWFQGIWNQIRDVFKSVKDWFSEKFSAAWKAVQRAWSGVKDFFSGIWVKITGVFSGAESWFGNTFGDAYKAITGAFSGLQGFFQNIWNGISGAFKGFIDGIIDGINTIIEGVDRLQFDVPSWVPGFGGQKWGFALPEIPRLASGGLAYAPTLAMVGDNPGASSNPEVVAPLDKLKAYMNGDNGEVISMLQTLIEVVKSKEFSPVLKTSDREIARASNRGNRSMGASILGGAFSP